MPRLLIGRSASSFLPQPILSEDQQQQLFISEQNQPVENCPVEREKQIEYPRLQELMKSLETLARYSQSLEADQVALMAVKLNRILQVEPCFELEKYQTRILQLNTMLIQAKQLSHGEHLCSVLNRHLIHAQQAAKTLHQNSAIPIQDSIWELYERILQLPTLQPDLFGAAVATLYEKLSYADSSHELIKRLTELLPILLPPSHYLWMGTPPFTDSLLKLQEIKLEVLRLSHHFKQLSPGHMQTFYIPLENIFEIYRNFIDEFTNASEEQQMALCMPKAQLSGVGLGFFSLDAEVAQALLSRFAFD